MRDSGRLYSGKYDSWLMFMLNLARMYAMPRSGEGNEPSAWVANGRSKHGQQMYFSA